MSIATSPFFLPTSVTTSYGSPTTSSPPKALWTSPEFIREKLWDMSAIEIQRLRSLKDNWDGSGADAPTLGIIATGLEFIRRVRSQELSPPSRIVPTPDGCILFEWRAGAIYVEAEISDESHVEWMIKLPGKPIQHRTDILPAKASDSVWNQYETDCDLDPSMSFA